MRVCGAAQAAIEKLGAAWWVPDRIAFDRHLALARARMPAEAFAAAWEDGRAVPLEQAVAEIGRSARSNCEK